MMNTDMQIIREVNIQAEGFYKDAIDFGRHAAYALQKEHRAQMTGLENVANSALKVADILDYIKRQTARSKESQQWRRDFPDPKDPQEEAFGLRLLRYLEENLDTRRNIIANRLNIGNNDREQRRSIHLHLIRQFVRQVVIQYEFCVIFGTEKKGA